MDKYIPYDTLKYQILHAEAIKKRSVILLLFYVFYDFVGVGGW